MRQKKLFLFTQENGKIIPLFGQFFSISCSFWEKMAKTIGWCPHIWLRILLGILLGVGTPVWEILDLSLKLLISLQWRIQDFSRWERGANPFEVFKTYEFEKIFSENCMQMKEIVPRGMRIPSAPPPSRQCSVSLQFRSGVQDLAF